MQQVNQMQAEEFEAIMMREAGFALAREHYESIVEPVYLAVNESKEEFARYCAEKDLNGLELLRGDLSLVGRYADVGMTIWQIHAVLLEARASRAADASAIRTLRDENRKLGKRVAALEAKIGIIRSALG
jgi:hypothetical protein